MRLVGFIK